jgi:hypothetical protein
MLNLPKSRLILAVLAVGIAATAIVWLVIAKSSHVEANRNSDYADDPPTKAAFVTPSPAQLEAEMSNLETAGIVRSIMKCRNLSSETMPADVEDALQYYHRYRPSIDSAAVRESNSFGSLTTIDIGVLYLSQAISARRSILAAATAQAQSAMDGWKWAAILVGAITTILVSIKSVIEPTGPIAKKVLFIVGLLAITFSAAGTATSALQSSFGSQEAFANNARALGDLRQLHAQIATGVAQAYTAELCGASSSDGKTTNSIATQVKHWSDQFSASLGIAGATPDQKSAGTSSGGNANGQNNTSGGSGTSASTVPTGLTVPASSGAAPSGKP